MSSNGSKSSCSNKHRAGGSPPPSISGSLGQMDDTGGVHPPAPTHHLQRQPAVSTRPWALPAPELPAPHSRCQSRSLCSQPCGACLSFPSRAAQQSHPAAPTPHTPPGGQTKWVNGGGSATQIPLRCPRWDCVMAHIAMAMPPLTTRVPAQTAVGASTGMGGQPQPQPPPLSRACFPQGSLTALRQATEPLIGNNWSMSIFMA